MGLPINIRKNMVYMKKWQADEVDLFSFKVQGL